MAKVAEKHGERFLSTPNNQISFGTRRTSSLVVLQPVHSLMICFAANASPLPRACVQA
jgi:hypothetical protein